MHTHAGLLLAFTVPLLLDGCCVGNSPKTLTGGGRGHRLLYRAVAGESFMVPCARSPSGRPIHSEWVGTAPRLLPSAFGCGRVFTVEVNHTGTYRSSAGGSEFLLQLQVLNETSVRCFHEEEEERDIELLSGVGGRIPCPGLNCSHNTEVTWYKGTVSVSELLRETCVQDGSLYLCEVKGQYDEGAYFCDRPIRDQGVAWTLRRAVQVRVVPSRTTSDPPSIKYPADNTTEDVELGQSHTLTCKAIFPYERKMSGQVNWYVDYGGGQENMTLLNMKAPQQMPNGLTRKGIIEEVTPQHLLHTFTCTASNTVGRHSVTIRLRKKVVVVKWATLFGYPIASVLLLAGLGVVVHVKWLEMQIIYRSHRTHGKQDEDEKSFDVFLSYVWAETDEGRPRVSEEDACPPSIEPLNPEGCEAVWGALQVRLRRVLEEEWGYRVCLLERDILPGGAFTNDVVLAIQRSRMLVCLLSADYLRNNDAVFVLESGIQALLQNTSVQLLLIRTCRDSTPQDPSLPPLVHRALKVLPCLMWSPSGEPADRFWSCLRKRLPDHRHSLVSHV